MIPLEKIIERFILEIILAILISVIAGLIVYLITIIEIPKKIRSLLAILAFLFICIILLWVSVYEPSLNLRVVPDLTGMSKYQAEELLKERGLQPNFTEVFNERVSRDMIVPFTQSPQPGTVVKVGSKVKADVSLGSFPNTRPPPFTSKEDAKRQIENAGLKVNFIEKCNDDIPDGHVIDQDPKTCIDPKSCPVVDIFISKRPRVPHVKNLTKDEAKNKIENEGLKANFVKEDYSNKIPSGRVICQYQKPNILAICGSDVRMIVSRGKYIIDAMDNPRNWRMYNDNKGSSCVLKVVPGMIGSAIEITYDLKEHGWLSFRKDVDSKMLSKMSGITFFYKGAGNPNTIEIKLMYSDGHKYDGIDTAFGFYAPPVKDDWKMVEVSYDEFKCWWPEKSCRENPVLDLSKVTAIEFAISNRPYLGDKEGQGKLIIDEFQGVVASEPDCSE